MWFYHILEVHRIKSSGYRFEEYLDESSDGMDDDVLEDIQEESVKKN